MPIRTSCAFARKPQMATVILAVLAPVFLHVRLHSFHLRLLQNRCTFFPCDFCSQIATPCCVLWIFPRLLRWADRTEPNRTKPIQAKPPEPNQAKPTWMDRKGIDSAVSASIDVRVVCVVQIFQSPAARAATPSHLFLKAAPAAPQLFFFCTILPVCGTFLFCISPRSAVSAAPPPPPACSSATFQLYYRLSEMQNLAASFFFIRDFSRFHPGLYTVADRERSGVRGGYLERSGVRGGYLERSGVRGGYLERSGVRGGVATGQCTANSGNGGWSQTTRHHRDSRKGPGETKGISSPRQVRRPPQAAPFPRSPQAATAGNSDRHQVEMTHSQRCGRSTS
eukprot:gene17311-biopygen14395